MPTKDEILIPAENILTIAIGVKEYTEEALHMLPAAENNANEFVDKVTFFGKPNTIDWQKVIKQHENICKRTDGAIDYSTLRSEIKGFIDKAIKNRKIELIVFYYSGHGTLNKNKDKYYLTVKETKENDLIGTAWEITNLFNLLAESRRKVIIILDSCFSENAFNFITSREDYYIIASSAYNETSKYPLNERNSAFTGTILEIIKSGIPGAGEFLTYVEIFEEVKRKLAEKKQPIPKSLDKNGTGNIVACRNNYKEAIEQPEEVFNLQGAINKIHRTLFPKQDFNDKAHEKIFNSYPNIISVYLRNFLADSKYLNDTIIDFYKLLISFLSFIFIKDLRDGRKLQQKDKDIFDTWKLSTFSHEHKLQIIKTAIQSYKDVLFIKGIKDSINSKIEYLESLYTREGELERPDDFKTMVFSLIEDLSFFKNYELLAIRFIEVKKSFFNLKNYKHEVSLLYGTDPSPYDYDFKGNQSLQSETDFLNNAVILTQTINPNDLNRIINSNEYLNLWPFIIDSCCNQKKASIPEICLFKNTQESFGNERHYNYIKLQYSKERKESIEDYSRMTVFPEPEEWEKYIIESF